MDEDLQRYSFHATWNLKSKLAKPFDVLMSKIDQHIKDETHETFLEEGLLFKSYLCMSGIGDTNKDKKKALECLNEAMDKLKDWEGSPTKDGFLSVAYALEAWIDMDKTEERLEHLHKLYYDNRNERRKPFEAAIHFIKGYSLSRLGSNRYIESIDEFRQASEKCPDNPEYLFSVALMTRRFYGPTKEVETILCKVLEMNKDYMYAKVELADLNRNKENISGAIKLLEQVTKTISSSNQITPEYMKILGHVMKIYFKINQRVTDEKMKDIYSMAVASGNMTSFIEHQRALLSKRNEQWDDYEYFLDNALKINRFNVPAKLGLAKQKFYKLGIDVIETYDAILSEHENDQLAAVHILFDYGNMLFKQKKEKLAIRRYERAMKITVKHFQLDFNDDKHRIKFISELSFQLRMCVLNLSALYQRTGNDKDTEIFFTLMKLHYMMRNLYLARTYCKRLLLGDINTPLHNKEKYEVNRILTEIEINLTSDRGYLMEIDNQIETLNQYTNSEPKKLADVQKLKFDLNFKKVMLRERDALLATNNETDSLLMEYCASALCGHKGAIVRLFSALEVMDENIPEFYEICAYLEISIAKFCTKDDSLQGKLKDILEAATSKDFKRLRNQQLEMEKALIKPADDIVGKMETVIQTSRNMLNAAMYTLEQRYCRSQTDGKENSVDFPCFRRNFDKNETENKVKTHLTKWNNVDIELVAFLVEIQPCTNPKANNWIKAFMDFNNITKHKRGGKEYGNYEVYEDDSTKLKPEEICTIDLARTVCSNISYIWDNLNGFSTSF